MISCRHVTCFQCTDETREEALEVLRLILQADALREHAYERGDDDDASIYELVKSLVRPHEAQ